MILTETMLRNAANEARTQYKYYALNESLSRFDSATTYDLFVSHSFRDKELVIGLLQLFTKAGYTVYVDWISDSTLDRGNVTPETAALIRQRIRQSKGTAYIATSNSNTSKWCPWELGVSDGMKGRVCILPVMESIFKGQEYLGLYPYLDYANVAGEYRSDFWITDQKHNWKKVRLRDWLRGMDPQ